jgi:hypothetical protein
MTMLALTALLEFLPYVEELARGLRWKKSSAKKQRSISLQM